MKSATLREALEPALFDLFDQAALIETSGGIDPLPGYRRHVGALREIAAAHRMNGLAYVGMLLDEGLGKLAAQQRGLTEDERTALADWPALVMTELLAPQAEAGSPGWSVLHGLRRHAWFPELPDYFWGVIETRLGEDVRCLAANSAPLAAAEPGPPIAPVVEPVIEPVVEPAVEPLPEAVFEPMEQDVLAVEAPADTGLPAVAIVAREELAALSDALAALHEDGTRLLAAPADAEGLDEAFEHYGEQLSHLVDAAQVVGLAGFQQVLELALINTVALREAPEGIGAAQRELLAHWPLVAMEYLAAPEQGPAARALAELAGDAAWPFPAAAADLPAWIEAMGRVQTVRARAAADRPAEALAEHVDLRVPADIDRNVLDSLLVELPQHAAAFSALVQRLGRDGTLEDMEEARRVAHTLKGAGNTVGVKGVANLTHALEDILVACGREQRLPTPALRDTLVEAADTLEAMSEAVLAGQATLPGSVAVHQKVLDWANRIDREGLPPDDEAPAEGLLAADPAAPAAIAAVADAAGEEAETMLRVPASLIDTLLKLAGENSIISSQIQDRVDQLGRDLGVLRTGSRQFGQLSHELEQLVDVRGGAMLSGREGELDALEMDQYNELHMLSRRIVESGADSREFSRAFEREVGSLRDLLAEKERVQLEIQRKILRTRMVEVASIAPRLQRTVRQAARVLGKAVTLQIEGERTLVDTQLLQRILDPLMHMLRNAVDHGIESADERRAAGKPAAGTITLRFAAIGAAVDVRCEDDGRGLDHAAIRDKALAVGLLAADAALDEEQTLRLILQPGFSTRDEATLISGRGIGMDVVNRAVIELRGTLEMQTEAGAWTRFRMNFPVQLSATQVMISRSARHVLALSVRGVDQILPVDEALQHDADGGLSFLLQGERLEALRLETLLQLPTQALRQSGAVEAVMIVRDEHRRRLALVVPELADSRNVVVKPFHPAVPRALGVDGATILGDGAIAPVLDLPDLLRAHRSAGTAGAGPDAPAVVAELPLCLVVDDSVSVRRTMEQLMQDAGYEVASARDGIDALGAIQRRVPDVVLVDLEMPRMNGLELTAALRNRADTRHTPVVMITSRFTDKHRQLADEAGVNAFLTKPYSEEQLLGTIGRLLQREA